jgi:hypothetical protein
VLYDREYGWDETFEALVAEIVGKFGKQHDRRGSAVGSPNWMAKTWDV